MEDLMLQSDCFGEALGMVREHLDSKNYYYYNPAYPNGCRNR